MLFLLTLSVVCHSKPLARHFFSGLERKTGFPNLRFSTQRDRCALPDNPSVIVNTNVYTGSNSLTDDKARESRGYGAETIFIESISWQWLYATEPLVSCELILTTKEASLSSIPYSWLPPVKGLVAVRWLPGRYWNSAPPLVNPIEQQEATFMLTEGDQAFAAITMMFGSGNNQHAYQQQGQPSESSGQRAPLVRGYFTNLLYSSSDDGDEDPQQHQHTLGLNCFVHPCHGVCEFLLSSDTRGSAEWPLNSRQSSHPHMANECCSSCIRPFDSENTALSINAGTDYTTAAEPLRHDAPMSGNTPSSAMESASIDQSPALKDLFEEVGTSTSLTWTDTLQVLSDHKIKCSNERKICTMPVLEKGCQPRLCWKLCKNDHALATHKSRYHSGQKTCHVTVIGEDGQPRLCRKVCKNTLALSTHRRRDHSKQETCDVILTGIDGTSQPCGKACKSAQALSTHKRRDHSGEQTCDVTMIAKDGQLRTCGKVYKSAEALTLHKSRYHSGQQICYKTVIAEEGQPQPCGRVCKNACALQDHKRKEHTGQQICDLTVVGEDGQLRPCGKTCKNAHALSEHKRRHRKRKPVDVKQNE
ncbi:MULTISPECIES: hypothetical protein [unclassified Endozoicomonas]|uniref:hypothetical protein n=1 Tax=unclassified Endozoicomonas TaxID=2644528 RepID=UPI002148F780|nr:MULTISPECIES: hypothetical protein [unclassified Endozoicomonas]